MTIDIFGIKRNADKMPRKEREAKIRRDLEDVSREGGAGVVNRDGARPATHATIKGDGRIVIERDEGKPEQ